MVERMIENERVITGSDAELLSRALAEVKTKQIYEESEARLADTQPPEALVSRFGNAEKEGHHAHLTPFVNAFSWAHLSIGLRRKRKNAKLLVRVHNLPCVGRRAKK
jgi:hypothetical protein